MAEGLKPGFLRTLYPYGKLTQITYDRARRSRCLSLTIAGGDVKSGLVYGEPTSSFKQLPFAGDFLTLAGALRPQNPLMAGDVEALATDGREIEL